MTSEHVRQCEDCRRIVGEASRFEPPPLPARAPMRRVWPHLRAIATAAGLTAVLVFSWPIVRAWRAGAPLRELLAAVPADGRYVEARISGGFRWAPLYNVTRGVRSSDPSHMRLVGVAGNVIEQTAGDPAMAAQHASAVARLLGGFTADASAQLSRLSQSSPEARIWSDLAAARYTEAVQNDEPPKLAQALAASESALHLNGTLPEALFNRALILERLGLRDTARTAWNRYLAADPASAWTHEAEMHVRALSGRTDFQGELARTYTALDQGGRSVADLVDRFPQDARTWGESEILNRWALCALRADANGAATHLRLARTIGDELVRRSNEMMLHDAVAAIDRAADRPQLAEAHVQFRQAQKTFKSGHAAQAEPLFRDAAAKFKAAGSPMALMARSLMANTVFEQQRPDEARAQLEQLSSQCPQQYKGLAAQIQRELGMTYAIVGRWGRALETLDRSIAGFEALRETNNEMWVREILAETYDRIGEPRKGWDHHIVALQELGRSNDDVYVPVYAIARSAAINRDWGVGLAFINLMLELGPDRGGGIMYTHGLLLRAALLAKTGDTRAAADDLAKSAGAIASIHDAAQRDRAKAESLAVQASLASSPAEAIDLLSRAMEVQSKTRRMFLPELLLQRGRAFERAGRHDEAANDFDSGIRELEAQRDAIAPGDERWGMFAAADELFDDAVELALGKSDPARAFAYSERARARELLDSMGMTAVPATPASRPDAVILEYVQLRDRIVIFVVDGARIRAVEEPLASAVVADAIDRLNRSATSGSSNDFNRAATELYDYLLGPVADELASGVPLIVVPDGVLSLVPFAALMDPAGRYVIERRPVIVAPSVAALRHRPTKTLPSSPSLLIVAGPASRAGDLGRLTAEQREIESVAAQYREVHHARGDVSDALRHPGVPPNVIHFVGHAVMPDAGTAGALVTSRRESAADQLDVREIAAMQLRDVDVVVLAACGTARGYGRVGESSVSVARAFLAAGVPSVAATLWPIEDGPAAEFFPRFHHYLVRGLAPAEALRAAQLEWIHRREISPGVWAAVELIGM